MEILRLLPVHLLARSVISLLCTVDLVHLDSACGCESDRALLQSILVFEAPFHIQYRGVFMIDAWKWFWRRDISIWEAGIDMSGGKCVTEEVAIIIENLHLLHGGIRVVISPSVESEVGFSMLANHSEAVGKVWSLTTSSDDAATRQLATVITTLRKFDYDGYTGFDDITLITKLIDQNQHLEEFKCLGSVDVSPWLAALARRGSTITSIEVGYNGIDDQHVMMLGNSCSNLQKIALICEEPQISAAGLSVLAVGCPKLRDVTLLACCLDDPLPILAQHCPLLQRLETDHTSTINGALLRLLHNNCPYLTMLHATVELAATAAEVYEHGAVFRRMVKLHMNPFGPTGQWNQAAITAVAANLHSLQQLYFADEPVPAEALRALATACHFLRFVSLVCESNETAANAAVLLARNNANLEELRFRESALLSDGLLHALGECCPKLTRLSAAVVPGGVHDAAVIAIAKGCRHLSYLEALGCGELSDAAMQVLQTYCPNLRVRCSGSQSGFFSSVSSHNL